MNDDLQQTSAENDRTEDMVITPAGPRPRERVHPVGPGEAVRRNEDGNLEVVRQEPRTKKPDLETQPERTVNVPEEMVLTPGGYKPKSLVHRIEPGHVLDETTGQFRLIHPSGRVAADFGPVRKRPGPQPLMPRNVNPRPGNVAGLVATVPAFGSGWITYADWSNTTGTPVSFFSTTWVVPPAPSTQNGQTIFLFNGIQNSTMIYQPVLQWGPSAAGGGNNWAVASWYADGQTGQSFYSSLVNVNEGDTLVGVMTLTGQAGGQFSYYCEFSGIANTGLPIQNVQELTWCIETLEAYGITTCSDYPNTADTAMVAIALQTGGVNPTLTWSPVDLVTDCGQHTVVVSNSSTNGEVDLFYRIPTVWQGNVTVTQTFTSNDSQNGWAYFQGIGWRKIQTGAPDGVTNMLALFAQAAAKGLPVTIYFDGSLVYQAYM